MDPHARHRHRTKRLLWTILVCATAASMSGNIAQAAIHHGAMRASGPVIAAAIPPLALLSLTHLTGMWSRITTRGLVYWCFLAAVAAITAAAFRLSFEAQRALAVQYGYSHADAALFPLILDGLIAVATLGLVVLARTDEPFGALLHHGDKHQGEVAARGAPALRTTDSAPAAIDESVPGRGVPQRAAHMDVRPPRGIPAGAPAAVTNRNGATSILDKAHVTSGDAAGSGESPPMALGVTHNASADASAVGVDSALQIAHRLIASGRTTAPLEAVHLVLVRTAGGASSRPVAAEVGLSYSTVQRIIRAAKELHQEPVG